MKGVTTRSRPYQMNWIHLLDDVATWRLTSPDGWWRFRRANCHILSALHRNVRAGRLWVLDAQSDREVLCLCRVGLFAESAIS